MTRTLIPVAIGVIICGYVLSRADEPRAEKLRDQQGLTGAMISIRLKNSEIVYHVEHALIKSMGGQMFLTGNLLLVRDKRGQQPPVRECRAWVPLDHISAMEEYKVNPFAKPAEPNPTNPDEQSNRN